MEKSKVYYTNLRVKMLSTLRAKRERLVRKVSLPARDLD